MDKNTMLLPGTAEEVMIRKLPTARKSDTVGHVLNLLAKGSWDDIETIYVASEEEGLLGMVPIHLMLISEKSEVLGKIMGHVKYKVGPHTDQEKLAADAIHKDVTSVPVVDQQNHLIGAVTSDSIIDILHDEHLEELLHSSGIHGKISHISDLINARVHKVVLVRLPWLLVGMSVGFLASLVISQFDDFLNANVQVAFFISMVAYLSGAMSIQSQIMFIRAITVMKFNIWHYLLRELFVGMIMGVIVGCIAAVGVYIISSSLSLAITIVLTLIVSMSVASVLACLVPLGLKMIKKDPAIGSGPFATAMQDLISITIYFSIAYLILGR